MSQKSRRNFGKGRVKQTLTHLPVLTDELIRYLAPKRSESYLDLTAGYGGHDQAILGITRKPSAITLIDKDEAAIEHLKRLFGGQKIRVIHTDFLKASRQLLDEGRQFNIVLADLGVSSPQLERAERGFSLSKEGPLDMRMDQNQTLTAAIVVNTWNEAKLADIFYRYGQEPRARAIARRIVKYRPVSSTAQLADIIAPVWPGRSRLHPATRAFQAIRIAVNSELAQLEASLPLWLELLAPGGRMAIISFHSLEDRLVKSFFTEHAQGRYDSQLQLLTKKPITAGSIEIVSNPRARSAKLRAAVKIKSKKKG